MDIFFEKIEQLSNCLNKYRNNKDRLLHVIEHISSKNKEEIDEIINKLDMINDKIDDISKDIDELQYVIDKNELTQTKEIKDRVNTYEINKKVYDLFAPYMLYYSIRLNMEQI